MKTPEKIYVCIPDDDIVGTASTQKGFPHQFVTEEYTRTDVFIEKAYSWLKNHYRDYMHNPTGERLEAFFGGDMCDDFENYMKGE